MFQFDTCVLWRFEAGIVLFEMWLPGGDRKATHGHFRTLLSCRDQTSPTHRRCQQIVTFKNHQPLLRCPFARCRYPNLTKAVGSAPLARRVAALRPAVHVFGHTHFGWDAVHDGIRYLQAPLCYPGTRMLVFWLLYTMLSQSSQYCSYVHAWLVSHPHAVVIVSNCFGNTRAPSIFVTLTGLRLSLVSQLPDLLPDRS